MHLELLTPHPALAPWIHRLWIFRSVSGLPTDDLRVVVPNGRPKLIVPLRNALTASRSTGDHASCGPARSVLIGLWETPVVISSPAGITSTIGVEFLPHGLRRFLAGDLDELTEQIVPLDAYLGPVGRALDQRVAEAPDERAAADAVQAFLLARLRQRGDLPATVDTALALLAASNFRMEIKELERRMGYSRRHLQSLFVRQTGLPPRRLAAILTFEGLYRRFARDRSATRLRRDALEHFYDQSHFIRSFRKFTGFSPGRFAELDNEFGRLFYRD